MDKPTITSEQKEVQQLFQKLFPICRSITGNGVRNTLSILNEISEFDVCEIPSGTNAYDWTVPDEWNIDDAYIEDSAGNKIVDFKDNNLHIVNYSTPIDAELTFSELESHLFTLPDLPTAIPYRTSYYQKNWGFCLPHDQFTSLDKNEKYHVKIESSLAPGHLTYGEYLIQGISGKEFLISTYCCHPSLANDNLSGPILWIKLLQKLKEKNLKHSYRFIIVPETIGAITYLSQNEKDMKNLSGGFILTCTAGSGNSYDIKQTFQTNHFLDNIVIKNFNEKKLPYTLYPFDINGSDETHFSAPFFRIPIITICRRKYYEYDFYHTSLDNLDFIRSNNLLETLDVHLDIINQLEKTSSGEIDKISQQKETSTNNKRCFVSLNPYCEPMLSKRGLYPTIGGSIKQKAFDFEKEHLERNYNLKQEQSYEGSEIDAIGWLMFFGDGHTPIEKISEKSGLPLNLLEKTATKLIKHKLLREN